MIKSEHIARAMASSIGNGFAGDGIFGTYYEDRFEGTWGFRGPDIDTTVEVNADGIITSEGDYEGQHLREASFHVFNNGCPCGVARLTEVTL